MQHLLELCRSLLLLTYLTLKLQLDIFLFFEDLLKLSLSLGISFCNLLHHAFNRLRRSLLHGLNCVLHFLLKLGISRGLDDSFSNVTSRCSTW